ncbi:MAG: response regulator [Lachnospiraceae bacterium]|nr:response regulator [Lachnospiraceae bacterium]
MYKILVVDDEKIERNGIRFLLKQMDFELEILEAENGKKAVELLKTESVDILLTDIKMPFMDGMELIATVRPLYPDMMIIIFSGFSDFEYAKNAMKYDVKDYILKPVEPAEFKNTLSKVVGELKEKQEQRIFKDMSQTFMEEHLLYSLVNGSTLSELSKEQGELIDRCGIQRFHQIVLLEFNEEFFGKNDKDLPEHVQECLGMDCRYLNLNPQQSIILLEEPLGENARETATALYERLKGKYTSKFYVGVCESFVGAENIYPQMEKLEKVMENKFFLTGNHVFLVEENQVEYAQLMDDNTLFKQMRQDIKMKDIPALKNHFGFVCDRYTDKTNYSQVYVKFIFSNFLKDFYDALPESERNEVTREIEKLYKATTFKEVQDIVNQNIERLERAFTANPQMTHREIEVVKQYIYDHYKEEISIDMLARMVYMAPSYLSAVFKKEVGQNLSKFIKEYRMVKAKDMLENTHMKIVQVSEAVGYPNVSYFCQSFREFFGISPQKFRNQGEE